MAKSEAEKAAEAFAAEQKRQAESKIVLIADTQGEILNILDQANDRINQILAGQPSDAQRWLLPQLQAQIRQIMSEFSEGAAGKLATALSEAWAAGQMAIDGPLEAAYQAAGVGFDLGGTMIDTGQLLAMRAFSTDRMKNVGAEAINKINTELGVTILGTQTPSEAVTAITDLLKESTRARAVTVVNTSLSQGYSAAAYARLKQQAALVPGLGKQWRASGKPHPRLNHHLIDGQVQPIDQPFRLAGGVELMFPHDPASPAKEVINCGCTLLPHKADWGDLATGGAMATPGRKYDAGPTMNEILASQDAKAGATLNQVPDAYAAAILPDGPHHGWMKKQLDLGERQLKRSRKSLNDRIEEHMAWIADPTSKVADWSTQSLEYQAGLLKKWNKDIDRQREQLAITEAILKEKIK